MRPAIFVSRYARIINASEHCEVQKTLQNELKSAILDLRASTTSGVSDSRNRSKEIVKADSDALCGARSWRILSQRIVGT